jgi:hypothetical protein
MTRNIEEQIRSYYLQQSLSGESLDRLRRLADRPEAKPAPAFGTWKAFAIAASVALAFLAGALFVTKRPATPLSSSVAETIPADVPSRIAREVAMRHHNCKHIEFTAPELVALSETMTNLDFPIVVPDVDMSRLTLQGAHYCVVDGRLALHATFIDTQGNTVSLMEVRSTPQFASLRHATLAVDHLEIDVWRKGEVLVAMARPSSDVS